MFNSFPCSSTRDADPKTSMPHQTLAAEAASCLVGTPWRDFDGIAFHADACTLAQRSSPREGPFSTGSRNRRVHGPTSKQISIVYLRTSFS